MVNPKHFSGGVRCLLFAFLIVATAVPSFGFSLGVMLHKRDFSDASEGWRISGARRIPYIWQRIDDPELRQIEQAFFRSAPLDSNCQNGLLPFLGWGFPGLTNGWIDTDEERTAFARFAATAVHGFACELDAVEIWNEWDYGYGGPDGIGVSGNPADYVALLKRSYDMLKETSPNLKIVGGSVSSTGFGEWLENACKEGLLDSLDVLSLHPYHSRHGGAYRFPEVGLRNELQRVYDVVARYCGGRRIPIWLTEIGYHTSDVAFAYSLEEHAKVIARAILLAWADPMVEALFYYKTVDDEPSLSNPVRNMGLLHYDGSPKPAYYIYQELANWIRLKGVAEPVSWPGIEWAERSASPGLDQSGGGNETLVAKTLKVPVLYALQIQFDRQPHMDRWVLWTVFPEDRIQIEIARVDERDNVQGWIPSITVRKLGERSRFRKDMLGGSCLLTVSDHPMVIEATDMEGFNQSRWRIRSAKILSMRERPVALPDSATEARPILKDKETALQL